LPEGHANKKQKNTAQQWVVKGGIFQFLFCYEYLIFNYLKRTYHPKSNAQKTWVFMGIFYAVVGVVPHNLQGFASHTNIRNFVQINQRFWP